MGNQISITPIMVAATLFSMESEILSFVPARPGYFILVVVMFFIVNILLLYGSSLPWYVAQLSASVRRYLQAVRMRIGARLRRRQRSGQSLELPTRGISSSISMPLVV
jgi:hypothetical protein